jgi:hypothetical protein
MLRIIFLIIFLIAGILFTIGYSLLPLIIFTDKVPNNTINSTVYINKLETDNKDNGKTSTTNYSDLNINSNYKLILQYLYYGCIISSCLIGGGIILSYLRMKLFSKILFILVQIFMSTFVSIILFLYYSSSFLENLISSSVSYLPRGISHNINASLANGGILIIASYIIIFVNYIIYSFIG